MDEPTAQDTGEEIEFKLAAANPAVLDAVAARSEIAGFRLRPAGSHMIRDRYYDTRGRDLSAHDFNLRLRIQDGAERLTLKRFGSAEAGLFRRREVELPATEASWSILRAELAAGGVELAAPAGGQPTDWLATAGLEVCQDRATIRRVLLAERDGQDLAELTLDTTTYRIGIYDVVFREVEVESRTADAEHVLAIGAALQAAYPSALAPSERGKYSRGLDLAARLA